MPGIISVRDRLVLYQLQDGLNRSLGRLPNTRTALHSFAKDQLTFRGIAL
jgi:hypothetical protein